jgi:uncharacterized protein involved in exopolysaccharide biosynthesis
MKESLEEQDSVLRDYMAAVRKHKGVIFVTVGLVMLFVFIGLEFRTPKYESSVKMLVLARKQIDSPYYKDISDFHTTEVTLTQSAIAESEPVIQRVVRRLRLAELPLDYEKRYASPIKALYISLMTKFLEAKLSKMRNEERNDYLFQKAVEDLKERISARPIRNTDLFTITVSDFSPENSAKIANIVSRSYCIFDLEQKLSELLQVYGEKHLYVIQMRENINRLEANLRGNYLSNIEAIGPASVKIIEQASISEKPVGISKVVVLSTALLMSVLLGGVLAIFFENF